MILVSVLYDLFLSICTIIITINAMRNLCPIFLYIFCLQIFLAILFLFLSLFFCTPTFSVNDFFFKLVNFNSRRFSTLLFFVSSYVLDKKNFQSKICIFIINFRVVHNLSKYCVGFKYTCKHENHAYNFDLLSFLACS